MLQDIRANIQGVVAKIIIGLIVVSFSIFGIESLLFSGGASAVAEVNGEEISPFALQQELSVRQRQLLSIMGDDADPALLDEARMSRQALEALIQREILRQASGAMALTVSDAAIGDIIGSMEQFQIDGRFSRERFQSALTGSGLTPALFRDRLAEDVQIGQLRVGIAGSDFGTRKELALAARIALEGRDVRYITLPLADYRLDASVSDAEVQAYYDANAEAFQSDESLAIDYLELRLEDYRQPVEEARLREEFELVRDEYEQAAQARVAHILLEGDDDDERRARFAEVQAALAEGLSFEEAAARFSDDVGSAGRGGDLGYTAGDTFPPAMEEAIGALAPGERSGPVETEAGTHLILVTERREGSAASFDSLAAELEDRIQRRDAAADLLRDVERLRDLAFNAADLGEPAAELDLEVSSVDSVTRNQTEGLFAAPSLLSAAFSEEVLEAGHNSDVIELDPEHFVVLRVAQRRPPAPLSLDAVRGQIVALLRDEAAQELAAQQARRLLQSIEAGTSVEDAANEAGLQWQVELGARRDNPRLPPAVRKRLFELPAPAEGAPRRTIVDAPADDLSETVAETLSETLPEARADSALDAYYVLEFVRLSEGSLDDAPQAELTRLRTRVSGENGGLFQQQFETALRSRADVEVF